MHDIITGKEGPGQAQCHVSDCALLTQRLHDSSRHIKAFTLAKEHEQNQRIDQITERMKIHMIPEHHHRTSKKDRQDRLDKKDHQNMLWNPLRRVHRMQGYKDNADRIRHHDHLISPIGRSRHNVKITEVSCNNQLNILIKIGKSVRKNKDNKKCTAYGKA